MRLKKLTETKPGAEPAEVKHARVFAERWERLLFGDRGISAEATQEATDAERRAGEGLLEAMVHDFISETSADPEAIERAQAEWDRCDRRLRFVSAQSARMTERLESWMHAQNMDAHETVNGHDGFRNFAKRRTEAERDRLMDLGDRAHDDSMAGRKHATTVPEVRLRLKALLTALPTPRDVDARAPLRGRPWWHGPPGEGFEQDAEAVAIHREFRSLRDLEARLDKILRALSPIVQRVNVRHATEQKGKKPTPRPRPMGPTGEPPRAA